MDLREDLRDVGHFAQIIACQRRIARSAPTYFGLHFQGRKAVPQLNQNVFGNSLYETLLDFALYTDLENPNEIPLARGDRFARPWRLLSQSYRNRFPIGDRIMKRARRLSLATFLHRKSSVMSRSAFCAVSFVVLTLAFLVALPIPVDTAWAGKGNGNGKPGGGEDPPVTLPDVRYVRTWLEYKVDGVDWQTSATDVNDSGVVVGYARPEGFVFVPEDLRAWVYIGSANVIDGVDDVLDLTDIIGDNWTDLDAEEDAETATGWIALRADGINENGEIVGTAFNEFTLEERAFLLIDGALGPEALLLPQVGVGNMVGAAVNDLGWVVGGGNDSGDGRSTILYNPLTGYEGEDLGFPIWANWGAEINNAGVIVTNGSSAAYRYTPGENGVDDIVEAFPDHSFYGINNGNIVVPAMICGARDRKRGKVGYEGGTIRLSEFHVFGDPVEILFGDRRYFQFPDINDDGDVCSSDDDRGYVYTDRRDLVTDEQFGVLGVMALDDLLLNPPDARWVDSAVYPSVMGNAIGLDDFGMICGISGLTSQRRAFLLTPIPFVQP